jgi:GAF domain-containing protein
MSSSEVSKQLPMPERFAALNRVGIALLQELDEEHLLYLIAQTACELTGASFAAFTLRPVSETGELLVPSEGNLFHLAAVVGVTEEQKALFRRMPLGGEGVLAPIFRHGVSVRVADLFAHTDQQQKRGAASLQARKEAQDMAAAYAHGEIPAEHLRSMGMPHGHPLIRSFLGAPLLDRDRQVRGGLLLGHEEPGCFTQEDEVLLISLASQAAVAIENGRLYRAAHMRAQEMQAIFESSVDGITLIDKQGKILQENEAAQRLRERLQQEAHANQALEQLFFSPARQVIATQQASQHTATIALGDRLLLLSRAMLLP